MNLYLEIKKKSQKLIIFFGFVGLIWWAYICKSSYNSFFEIPNMLYYLPYLCFFVVLCMGLINWYKLFKLEKNIINLKTEMKP